MFDEKIIQEYPWLGYVVDGDVISTVPLFGLLPSGITPEHCKVIHSSSLPEFLQQHVKENSISFNIINSVFSEVLFVTEQIEIIKKFKPYLSLTAFYRAITLSFQQHKNEGNPKPYAFCSPTIIDLANHYCFLNKKPFLDKVNLFSRMEWKILVKHGILEISEKITNVSTSVLLIAISKLKTKEEYLMHFEKLAIEQIKKMLSIDQDDFFNLKLKYGIKSKLVLFMNYDEFSNFDKLLNNFTDKQLDKFKTWISESYENNFDLKRDLVAFFLKYTTINGQQKINLCNDLMVFKTLFLTIQSLHMKDSGLSNSCLAERGPGFRNLIAKYHPDYANGLQPLPESIMERKAIFEYAFRRAAACGALFDMITLSIVTPDINAQAPQSKKTALHFAAEFAAHSNADDRMHCYDWLMEDAEIDASLRDSQNKTALEILETQKVEKHHCIIS